MSPATIETRDDNEVCQHIAMYSLTNLSVCACLHVCVHVCGLSCSSKDALHLCVGRRHSRTQHDDQYALVYSYPECKSNLGNTLRKKTFQKLSKYKIHAILNRKNFSANT